MIYLNWKEINPLFFIIFTWVFAVLAIISVPLGLAFFSFLCLILFSPALILGFTRSFGHLSKMDDKWRFVYFFLAMTNVLLFLAFLFPPCKPPKSQYLRSRMMISSIAIAIQQYKNQYGSLPCDRSESDKTVSNNNPSEYDTLFEVLSCNDGPDDGEDVTINSKNIRFIETPENFEEKGFLDCYGNRFMIIFDSNYDNRIMIREENIVATVAVYSFGKNGKDDQGKEDDIYSWE